jgi:hypothetical protein
MQKKRFLIARKYNVEAAATLILSAVKWRSERIPKGKAKKIMNALVGTSFAFREGQLKKLVLCDISYYVTLYLILGNPFYNLHHIIIP